MIIMKISNMKKIRISRDIGEFYFRQFLSIPPPSFFSEGLLSCFRERDAISRNDRYARE